MTVFHLGFNNCFAVKRWPLPADWAEICAKELEVDLVQFSFDILDPITSEPVLTEMVSQTVDALHETGLTVHSTFTGLAAYSRNLLTHPNPGMRADAIRWYAGAVKMTRKMGAKITGGHMAALSCRDYADVERRKNMMTILVENLWHLSSLAAHDGLNQLLWEPMPLLREPPCTIEDSVQLLKRVNEESRIPVKLTIDTGHQCTVGVENRDNDVYAWLRELAADSPVVHVQQTDGKGDRHWPFTKKYNKIGLIEPRRVIDAIEGSGAKEVCLILEVVHPFEAEETKVIEDLKTSANYWKTYV